MKHICIQNCVNKPYCPVMTYSKSGFAAHFSPQDQVLISSILQATVEAYQLYGLNAATSSGDNILVLFKSGMTGGIEGVVKTD